MIFLLDTNAFSDLMREHPTVETRMKALSDQDSVMICPVVRGEILYGKVWPLMKTTFGLPP